MHLHSSGTLASDFLPMGSLTGFETRVVLVSSNEFADIFSNFLEELEKAEH